MSFDCLRHIAFYFDVDCALEPSSTELLYQCLERLAATRCTSRTLRVVFSSLVVNEQFARALERTQAETLCCGAERDRTDDLRLAKPALSQLSYSPIA